MLGPALYPESKFSFDGTQSYFQMDTVAKLIKFLQVPVVIMITHGGYITKPQWNRKLKSIPLRVDSTCIISKEETKTLSIEEIELKIKKYFIYDDSKYQLDNNIKIKYKKRANNLNKILYKCPICGEEHKMEGKGIYLTYNNCQTRWEYNELGQLKCLNHKDIYTTIPSWFNFQREEVKKEILNGSYLFEDEV